MPCNALGCDLGDPRYKRVLYSLYYWKPAAWLWAAHWWDRPKGTLSIQPAAYHAQGMSVSCRLISEVCGSGMKSLMSNKSSDKTAREPETTQSWSILSFNCKRGLLPGTAQLLFFFCQYKDRKIQSHCDFRYISRFFWKWKLCAASQDGGMQARSAPQPTGVSHGLPVLPEQHRSSGPRTEAIL